MSCCTRRETLPTRARPEEPEQPGEARLSVRPSVRPRTKESFVLRCDTQADVSDAGFPAADWEETPAELNAGRREEEEEEEERSLTVTRGALERRRQRQLETSSRAAVCSAGGGGPTGE